MRLVLLTLNGLIVIMYILVSKSMIDWEREGKIGWFLIFGASLMNFLYLLGGEG